MSLKDSGTLGASTTESLGRVVSLESGFGFLTGFIFSFSRISLHDDKTHTKENKNK
jgi:hypothetical protein